MQAQNEHSKDLLRQSVSNAKCVFKQSNLFVFAIHSENFLGREGYPNHRLDACSQSNLSALSIFNICNVSIKWEDVITFSNVTYNYSRYFRSRLCGTCSH